MSVSPTEHFAGERDAYVGEPVVDDRRAVIERDVPPRGLDVALAQHMHAEAVAVERVRAEVEPEPVDGVGPRPAPDVGPGLDDGDGSTGVEQVVGGGQAGEAGTDHHDGMVFHHRTPRDDGDRSPVMTRWRSLV